MNSFFSSRSISVDSLDFLHRQSSHLQIGTVLFFLSDRHKFYFSCFNALTRTSCHCV